MRSFRSKVVIRNLPPSFTTGQLDKLLAQWRNDIEYLAFYPGKPMSSLSGKGQRKAKAIVSFTEPSTLLNFVQKITSKPYEDEKGQMHDLVVEFCSYQVVPSPSSSVDPLCGTLEEDADYQRFLEVYSKDKDEEKENLPLESQLEAMILKERELFPWKYDKSYVRPTALLEHLQHIPLDPKITVEDEGKKKKEEKTEKKKKKKTKSKKKKERTDPVTEIVQQKTNLTLAPEEFPDLKTLGKDAVAVEETPEKKTVKITKILTRPEKTTEPSEPAVSEEVVDSVPVATTRYYRSNPSSVENVKDVGVESTSGMNGSAPEINPSEKKKFQTTAGSNRKLYRTTSARK